MTHFISEPCVSVKDAACVAVCPVDCIHTTPEAPMYYINPDECVDCGACLPVCPVEAIHTDLDYPEDQGKYLAINAEFFR